MANIKQANKEMESGKRDKSIEAKRLVKDEYDMVPTRLRPVSATANGMTFTTQMEKRQPDIARIPSRKVKGTYDPSRVKSSIPGAGSSSFKPQSSYRKRRTQENAVSYVEELKRNEVDRAVKMEHEQ